MEVPRDDVLQKIKQILVDELNLGINIDEIDADAGLASSIGVDSLGFIELKYQCEDVFGIKITDQEFLPENFRNCRVLADLIAARLNTAGSN